jgi:hypothetical protein
VGSLSLIHYIENVIDSWFCGEMMMLISEELAIRYKMDGGG